MKKIIVGSVLFVVLLTGISYVRARAITFLEVLPNGQVGVPYLFSGFVSDTVGVYSCSSETGLPAGLSFGTNAVVEGTPTEAGSWNLNVTCTDEGPNGSNTHSVMITIDPEAVPTVVPTVEPTAVPTLIPTPTPTSGPTNTGKLVIGAGYITAVTADSITVDKVLVKITAKTVILKANKRLPITVGQKAAYTGYKFSDETVSALLIAVGK